MTELHTETASGVTKHRWRNWLVLPALGLATILFLIGAANVTARLTFHGEASFLPCLVPGPDWASGETAPPNTHCRDKVFEGHWIDYYFNNCGHRTNMNCGPKAPGTYRIVLVGSSVVMGHRVEQDKTFAALLGPELSRRTGRRVEVYNEGLVTVHPAQLTKRFHEALAQDPDLVVWPVTPPDVERVLPPGDTPAAESGSLLARLKYQVKQHFAGKTLLAGAQDFANDTFDRELKKFDESEIGALLLHEIYKSQSQYIKSVLAGSDEQGFLRRNPSEKWKLRLSVFQKDFDDIEQQATAAHVPVAVVLIPTRGQAALLSQGDWPSEDDPYALDNDLRPIITGDGGTYLDILQDYRKTSHMEELYLPVDGHPTEQGQGAIAKMLADALTNGRIPALAPRH